MFSSNSNWNISYVAVSICLLCPCSSHSNPWIYLKSKFIPTHCIPLWLILSCLNYHKSHINKGSCFSSKWSLWCCFLNTGRPKLCTSIAVQSSERNFSWIFWGVYVFKLIPRWFHILSYLSIFFIWKLLSIWWSSQGFFWFLKANGWFTNDKFDHFQQENKLTVLCQWFLSLITSFKLNGTFCRIFFSQNFEERDCHKGTSFLFRNKMRLLPHGLSSQICLMYMLCE